MKCFTFAIMILVASVLAFSTVPVRAQQATDLGTRIAAQQKAMQSLNAIDGVWRGTTTEYRPDGTKLERGYTERISSLLDGTLKLLEGSKESVAGGDYFHVICVLSHDPDTKQYTMRVYWPNGMANNAAFKPRSDGFEYRTDLPDGRYIKATGTVKDGVWHEKFELVTPGKTTRLLEERVLKHVDDGRVLPTRRPGAS